LLQFRLSCAPARRKTASGNLHSPGTYFSPTPLSGGLWLRCIRLTHFALASGSGSSARLPLPPADRPRVRETEARRVNSLQFRLLRAPARRKTASRNLHSPGTYFFLRSGAHPVRPVLAAARQVSKTRTSRHYYLPANLFRLRLVPASELFAGSRVKPALMIRYVFTISSFWKR
jgi:hypothetical protein